MQHYRCERVCVCMHVLFFNLLDDRKLYRLAHWPIFFRLCSVLHIYHFMQNAMHAACQMLILGINHIAIRSFIFSIYKINKCFIVKGQWKFGLVRVIGHSHPAEMTHCVWMMHFHPEWIHMYNNSLSISIQSARIQNSNHSGYRQHRSHCRIADININRES